MSAATPYQTPYDRIGGADAVLAASIFHYGQHTVAEAKALMAARGIPIRQ